MSCRLREIALGARYGPLTVVGPGGRDARGEQTLLVQCLCGATSVRPVSRVVAAKECRCGRRPASDVSGALKVGALVGSWLVDGDAKDGFVRVKCACGRTEKWTQIGNLLRSRQPCKTCRREGAEQRRRRVCVWCGVEFLHHSGHPNGSYCSNGCYAAAKTKPKPIYTCQVCGDQIKYGRLRCRRCPQSRPSRRVAWSSGDLAQLGRQPDAVIARAMGISDDTVRRKRRGLGVAAHPKRRSDSARATWCRLPADVADDGWRRTDGWEVLVVEGMAQAYRPDGVGLAWRQRVVSPADTAALLARLDAEFPSSPP